MSTLPSYTASAMTPAASRRRRIWHIAVGVMVIALAAGVAGAFIGRATKTGEEAVAAPSWQPLPKAPIAGRLSPGAVWTGKEMIVWGGSARSGTVTAASDGAAYNPATRTWRTIAPSPAGVEGAAAVVWTGDKMVVWASNSPDGPVGAAVYDPSANSWRRLPAGPLGRREGYWSVWTGNELIVIGGTVGDTLAKPIAAALDPAAGTWRLLPGLNRLAGLLAGGAVWDGREVLVKAGGCSTGTDSITSCRSIFLAYNSATDKMREIALPAPSATFGADTAASLKPIGWTGTEVVFTAAVAGSVQIIRYNPTIDGWKGKAAASCHIVDNPAQGRGCRDWRKGPYAPCYIPGAYTQAAWLGDRYAAACGTNGLQVYGLATSTWTWRTITPGPSPLNSREGSAIVWTGTDLIAWSGTVYERFNPAPNDGASLTLMN